MITKAEKETTSMIGGLFIRVLDIINYTQRKDSTDVIDAWFEIAPVGKVRLTIKYGKGQGSQISAAIC